MNTSLRRRDADIRSAAAAARRSVTIGGGGVSKMSAAAARRTALMQTHKNHAVQAKVIKQHNTAVNINSKSVHP